MYLPYPSYGNNGNASNGNANNQQNNTGSQNSVTGQSNTKTIHPTHAQFQSTQPGSFYAGRTSQSPVPPLGGVSHRGVLSTVNSTSLSLPHPNAVPFQQQQLQNQQSNQQQQQQQQYLAPSQFQQQVSPQNQHQQMYQQQQSPKQKQQYDQNAVYAQQQYTQQQYNQQQNNQQQQQQQQQGQQPQGKEKKPKQKRITKKQLLQQQQALEEERRRQEQLRLELEAQARAQAQAQAQAQVQALQVMQNQNGEKKRRGRPKKLILDPETNQYIDSHHPRFKQLNKNLKITTAELAQSSALTDHHYSIGTNQTTINPSATTTTAPIQVSLPIQGISNGKPPKPEKELTPDLSRLFEQPTYLRTLSDPSVQNLIQKKDRRGRPRKFPVEQTGVTIKGIRVNGSIKTTKVQKK
ncbi:hypothetical protein DFJ63DRAFT_316448 [Scheffersomyces coipomensis]|uniref:uncharacterized protein n=1 Tax=Scheffersomyces coipomensis TaxID=1788519 RepID=UPI00315C8360